ncbi:hypothetical protein [Candidatus Electronema sp. TJ]|uniref:hypothetical protein n=1 Tax=Candidatus Electronema sp. TJ TaxID=3401573 RepID=UPI003AA98135
MLYPDELQVQWTYYLAEKKKSHKSFFGKIRRASLLLYFSALLLRKSSLAGKKHGGDCARAAPAVFLQPLFC